MDNQPDPYEAVLADLHRQRDRIDQAISVLTALRGGVTPAAAGGADGSAGHARQQTTGLGPGAFLGMTIADAAKKLLAHERRQMGNPEIAEMLQRGGLVLNSADPMNTIGSVLTRRFQQVGDIVKVGRGVWGLKEWYPNRSFAKPTKGSEPAATNGPMTNDELADDSFESVAGFDPAAFDVDPPQHPKQPAQDDDEIPF